MDMGFFLVYVLACFLKLLSSDKAFRHRLHGYGLSHVCVPKCFFKRLSSEKSVRHRLHGFVKYSRGKYSRTDY